MLNEALKLARRGFAVVPLIPGRKSPACAQGVKQATKNEDEIKALWLNSPRAHVGIALGPISGLVGIDVDRNHGATDEDIRMFPRTVTVKTRHGFHLYFRYPAQGVDPHTVIPGSGTQGAGYLRTNGYFVAPPSVVSYGNDGKLLGPFEYGYHADAGGELSFDDCEIAELPEWCLVEISGRASVQNVRMDGPRADVSAAGRRPSDSTQNTQQGNGLVPGNNGRATYPENTRHAFYVTTATSMWKEGKSKEEIRQEIYKNNERNCNPPKPKEVLIPEVEGILKWLDTVERDPIFNQPAVAMTTNVSDHVGVHSQPDSGLVEGGEVAAAGEQQEKAEEPKKKKGRPKKPKDEKPSPYFLACQFLFDMGWSIDVKHTLRYHQQDWYLYNGRDYRTFHDESLKDEINRWLVRTGREKIAGTRDVVTAMIQNIKTKPRFVDPNLKLPVMMDGLEATEVSHLMPLENGLLDLRAWSDQGQVVIHPHSHNYFCTHSLPFPFKDDATCPIYDRIVNQAFDCEGDRLLWEEILGIHLYQPLPLEHFFILQGEGANSKSVLVTILTCLLGAPNVSSVPLECFHPENFSFAKTHGKLANIISDQHDIENVNEGLLKQFVSREPMTYNRKFKDPITARPTAYLTICTNNLPRFVDKTDAIYRRLVLLQFTKQVARENQDRRFISQEFWNQSGELPGILNRALAGLRRATLNRGLTIPNGMISNVTKYRDDLNPIAPFAKDVLVYGEDKWATSAAVYKAYSRYCEENGLRALNSPNFSRRLKVECARLGHGVDLSEKNIRKGNYTGRIWSGLQPNTDQLGAFDPDAPRF